jgi:hypothetical protein
MLMQHSLVASTLARVSFAIRPEHAIEYVGG